jgi:hypothetical protein
LRQDDDEANEVFETEDDVSLMGCGMNLLLAGR